MKYFRCLSSPETHFESVFMLTWVYYCFVGFSTITFIFSYFQSQRQMREYLIRLLYCEMLGVNCPWGHIHAVTFTQSNNIVDKRIGYLTCSLVLHPDHELNMLLVNSIQRVGDSHLCMYMYINCMYMSVFLISLYGAPLA